MSKRYIDANKLIERLRHNPDFLTAPKHSKDGIIDEIVYQPTADVVEVVRCKDCKHYKYGACTDERNIVNCMECGEGYCLFRLENFYCSYGERKDECESKK